MGTERNQTRLLVGMASMQTPSFVVSDRCSSVFCLSRAYSYFSTGCAILQVDITAKGHVGGAGSAKTPKVSETFGVCPSLRVRGYVAAMESRPTCAVAARRGEGTRRPQRSPRPLGSVLYFACGGTWRLWKAALRVLSPRGGARGTGGRLWKAALRVLSPRGGARGTGGYGKPPYVCCRREAGRGDGRLWKAALRVLSPRGGARGTRRPQRSPRPLGSVLRFACGGTWRLGVADAPRLTAVRRPLPAVG